MKSSMQSRNTQSTNRRFVRRVYFALKRRGLVKNLVHEIIHCFYGLWQLSYEQRQTIAEYRDAAQKLTLAGYNLADPGRAISDISQRLETIDTARKNERELAAEYRTLLQVRHYVKLANEPKFVKGSIWENLQTTTELSTPTKESSHNVERSGHNNPQKTLGKQSNYETSI